MAKLENEMQHQGIKAWVEKLQKKRYEIVSVENLGGITRAYLDIFPGLCGSKVVFYPFRQKTFGLTFDQERPW